jgi:hypothetical protein
MEEKSGKAKQSKAEVCFGLSGSFSFVFLPHPKLEKNRVGSSLDRNRISGAHTLEFTVSLLKLVSLNRNNISHQKECWIYQN